MSVFTRKMVLGCGVAAIAMSSAPVVWAQAKAFDVPSDYAVSSIPEFARQADIQIVAPAGQLNGVKTGSLKGSYDVLVGLNDLLQGTGLRVAASDDQTVVLRVAQEKAVANEAQEAVPASSAQSVPDDTRVAPASEQSPGDADSVETVTITGTSIRGVAPVGGNLVTVGRQAMESTGAISTQQILKNVPAITNMGNSGVGANSRNNYYAPTIHSLGGSASNSTLVLIDGHRIPLGFTSLTLPDPNMIPAIALERVEVLAEGASSVYGSDAVAGVVNFITRDRYDGIQVNAQTSFGDDYTANSVGLLGGTSWDTGSAMVAFGYTESSRIPFDYSSRPFLHPNHIAQGGTNFQSFNCSPATVQPAGSSGIYLSPTSSTTVANLSANAPCDSKPFGVLAGRETRYNMMVKIHQSVGDRLDLSGDFVYSDRSTITPLARGGIQATVFRTGAQANPFYVNPPDVVPGTTAGDRQTIRWNADQLLGPGAYNDNSSPTFYGSMNAEWKINDNFRATAMFLYGEDRTADVTDGTLCASCATLALNGTTNTSGTLNLPIAGTNLVVEQPLTTSNALDVWNAPGSNLTSPAVLKQLTDYRRAINQLSTVQQARIGIDGTLFDLPAGEVKIALGGEALIYHLDTVVVTPLNSGPASVGSSQRFFPLRRTVQSAYGELHIPIVSPDMDFIVPKIDLSISGRYDKYSDFGDTFNPKFAMDVELFQGFKLRGNWSTSFVAPSMRSVGDPLYGTYSNSTAGLSTAVGSVPESRYPTVSQIPGIVCSNGFCTIGQGNAQGINVDTGNPNVGPQEGTTWSVGFDYSPHFIPGLSTSVTLFTNELEGGITSPCHPSCVVNNANLNSMLTIYPNGATPEEIAAKVHDVPVVRAFPANVYYIFVTPQTNAIDLDIQGLDVSLNYAFDTSIGNFNLGGSLTEFLKFDQAFAGGQSYSILNTVGINYAFPSIARQARLSAGWSYDRYSVQLFANHVGSYKNWGSGTINPVILDANGNASSGGDTVKSNTTLDVHASYGLSSIGDMFRDSEIYLDVNNVFDEEPSFVNATDGYSVFSGNPLGRVVSIGLRGRW